MSLENSPTFTTDQRIAMQTAAGLQDYLDLRVRLTDGMPPTAVTAENGIVYTNPQESRMHITSRSYSLAPSSGPVRHFFLSQYVGEPRIEQAGTTEKVDTFRQPEHAVYSGLRIAYTGLMTIRTPGVASHERYVMFRIHEPQTPIDRLGLIVGGLVEHNCNFEPELDTGEDCHTTTYPLLDATQVRQLRDHTKRFVQEGVSVHDLRAQAAAEGEYIV